MSGLRRLILCLFLCVCTLTLLGGCAGVSGDTRIVLTTGLKDDEVFRIESVSCTVPEMMVYLTNMQNQYENVYGQEIWKTMSGDVTLEQRVKDNCLARMAQVKTMNLMAHSMKLSLTQQEKASAEQAAGIYYESLNNTEREAMGIDQETIASLYREYLLAGKVYQEIVKDVNPEISDDEARNISVEYILIKTYEAFADGTRREYDENERMDAYQKAKEAYQRAVDGEDFESLIMEYSDDDEMMASIGKGDDFSDYARTILFELSKDEISPILTLTDGYMIARCMSTFDMEETDLNKARIVDARREEAFSKEYDAYVESLTRKLNVSLWESIAFLHDDNITTSDFFKVADDNLQLDSL